MEEMQSLRKDVNEIHKDVKFLKNQQALSFDITKSGIKVGLNSNYFNETTSAKCI